RVAQRPLPDEALLLRPRAGVGDRQVGARDRGGAGATVSLQDVAVYLDRVLPQQGVVDGRPQRPADQPRDLLGAAAGAALDGFARAAGVRGPGQHRILRGDPALTGVAPPAWHPGGERGHAQHAGAPELHETGTLSVVLPTPVEADRSQLVGGSAV